MKKGENIKIFMICSVFLDRNTGQTIHIMEIFNNLSKLNNRTFLFAPKPREAKNKTPNIIFVPTIFFMYKFFYQILLFFYLIYYTLKLHPDIIYTRHFVLNISPLLISKIFNLPHIVEVNGLILDELIMHDAPRIYILLAKMSEKLNYIHADKIIAITHGIKAGLVNLYEISSEKIVVIENGANTDLFKPMEEGQMKEILNLDSNTDYVCFVGSLVSWQGVEYLIRSASLIIKKYHNVKFLIVGNGPMKTELMRIAEEAGVFSKFLFVGEVQYADVPKYINACKVCVAPKKALSSGFSPLKLYEYMACGKPVVATNLPGFEVVEKYNAGILFDLANPDVLATAIINILDNKWLRKTMGKNGREFVLKHHSWYGVAKNISIICHNIVKKYQV